MLAAALTATRRDLTDAALLALALRAPLATLKVIAAIHWEALRLWREAREIPPRAAGRRAVDRRARRQAFTARRRIAAR